MTGTRGRTAGNALGVLGLLFAGIESGLGYLNDGSVSDSAATVSAGDSCSFWPGYLTMGRLPSCSFSIGMTPSAAAGFGTGALFRSARGPRAAVVAGTVGAMAAASLVAARQTLSQNL